MRALQFFGRGRRNSRRGRGLAPYNLEPLRRLELQSRTRVLGFALGLLRGLAEREVALFFVVRVRLAERRVVGAAERVELAVELCHDGRLLRAEVAAEGLEMCLVRVRALRQRRVEARIVRRGGVDVREAQPRRGVALHLGAQRRLGRFARGRVLRAERFDRRSVRRPAPRRDVCDLGLMLRPRSLEPTPRLLQRLLRLRALRGKVGLEALDDLGLLRP
mmetsp:Transcript_23833/g.80394  ORF Transcript_23833/g.80394 Transcript_23833/m.80394 type:complete len:219 (-) Transcript_23833:319-975(-)